MMSLVGLFSHAIAQPRMDLTGKDAVGWSKGADRSVVSGESLAFRFPDGKQGVVKKGFQVHHDGTRDWRAYEGLEIDMVSEGDREVELKITVLTPPGLSADVATTGSVRFRGSRKLYISWDCLDYPKARTSWQKFVKGIDLEVRYLDGKDGSATMQSVAVVKAPSVALESEIRGKSTKAGEKVS